uniref:Uncharacterized protein n=1 Tax=Plectus sambesii TaxID=2011161 RepID=A0A914X7K5_9BILA
MREVARILGAAEQSQLRGRTRTVGAATTRWLFAMAQSTDYAARQSEPQRAHCSLTNDGHNWPTVNTGASAPGTKERGGGTEARGCLQFTSQLGRRSATLGPAGCPVSCPVSGPSLRTSVSARRNWSSSAPATDDADLTRCDAHSPDERAGKVFCLRHRRFKNFPNRAPLPSSAKNRSDRQPQPIGRPQRRRRLQPPSSTTPPPLAHKMRPPLFLQQHRLALVGRRTHISLSAAGDAAPSRLLTFPSRKMGPTNIRAQPAKQDRGTIDRLFDLGSQCRECFGARLAVVYCLPNPLPFVAERASTPRNLKR